MLTTRRKTPSNIVVVVVLFLKIKQEKGKKVERRKTRKITLLNAASSTINLNDE
jgi:hypothetical protein